MSIDAMKQALAALEQYTNVVTSVNDPNSWVTVADGGKPARDAITALRAAIEQAQPDELMIWKSRAMNAERIIEKFMQPEQEPVFELGFGWLDDATKHPRGTKLYATPPQRQWQGLTDEEIAEVRHLYDWTAGWTIERFARAIEAKLKEKNT